MDPTKDSTGKYAHGLGSICMAGRRGESAQAYCEWTVSVEAEALRNKKAGGSSEKRHEQSNRVQTWTSRNEGVK